MRSSHPDPTTGSASSRALGSATTPSQLRRLLEANRLTVEHLDLPRALGSVVEAAVGLVGAAYGALGVLGPHGELEDLIEVGTDGAPVAVPADLPTGPVSADARSVGLPGRHPTLHSYLGVAIEVRDEVYGYLYLADPREDCFGVEDQELVQALATTAGVAIAHARLFQESTRRELWVTATREVTHELLTDDDVDALGLVAHRVRDLTDAVVVAVVLTHVRATRADPGEDGPVVDRAVGSGAATMPGRPLPAGDTLVGRCLATRRPQLVDRLAPHGELHGAPPGLGPAMAVPLPSGDGVRGALVVLRAREAPRFTELDLDVAASFAGQAALALDLADARAARASNLRLEEQDRIARDLHDHVIQRLFAAGLTIQSVSSALGPSRSATLLDAQVEEIDATIRQIRTTIFGLHAHRSSDGLRAQLLDVAASSSAGLHAPAAVVFRGPIDLVAGEALCAEAVAVLREALSNVARHAHARGVEVVVAADHAHLSIEVRDDGVGIPAGAALSGLDNLAARARLLRGDFTVGSPDGGPGTRLRWVVPVHELPGVRS